MAPAWNLLRLSSEEMLMNAQNEASKKSRQWVCQFERFAHFATMWTGSSWAFALALFTVIFWAKFMHFEQAPDVATSQI